MTERNMDAIANLEIEARKVAAGIKANQGTALSTLAQPSRESELRSTVLQRLSTVVLTYVVGLVVTQKHLLHFEWWERHFGTNITNDQKMTNAAAVFDSMSSITFLSAYSTLEALIRQILYSFDPNACNESTAGYWKVRTYLFEHHLVLEHQDYSSMFQLTSTLRNCIHNQGVYRHAIDKELIIEHNQIRYTFLNMIPPNCLQPENLLSLLSEMGEMIFDILSDPNVKNLSFMEDHSEKLGTHDTALPL